MNDIWPWNIYQKSLEVDRRWQKQTFEKFVQGRIRQDLNKSCLGHLGPSLIHPRSWFLLTILFDLRSLQENRAYFLRILTESGPILGIKSRPRDQLELDAPELDCPRPWPNLRKNCQPHYWISCKQKHFIRLS